jgi:hypothetical protein
MADYSYQKFSHEPQNAADHTRKIDKIYAPIADLIRGHFEGIGGAQGRDGTDRSLMFTGLTGDQTAKVALAVQERLKVGDAVVSTIGGRAQDNMVAINPLSLESVQKVHLYNIPL